MAKANLGLLERILKLFSLVSKRRHEASIAVLRGRYQVVAKDQAKLDFNRGHTEGRSTGFSDGHTEGLVEGHTAGVRAARKAYAARLRRRRDAIEAAARDRSRWLVTDRPVGISRAMQQAIRAGVTERIPKGPAQEQWNVILSDVPATYVVAGAGSGKSTTLVLRVIALTQYRRISLKRISVFTFTKASRKDFVKKLRERFEQWGEDIDMPQARRVVRTFHSMILRMARATMPSPLKVLELLDLEQHGEVEDSLVENLLELGAEPVAADVGGVERPSASSAEMVGDDLPSKTPRLRNELLREAYERAFSESKDFRDQITRVYKFSLCRPRRDGDDNVDKLIGWVKELDARATAQIEQKWADEISSGLWPLTGIRTGLKPVVLSTREKAAFYVHGEIPSMNAYVVLCGAKNFANDKKTIPSAPWINSKRKALATISDKPIIWIDTVEELRDLATALRWFADTQLRRSEAPMFRLVPPREIKVVDVATGLFEQAQFIENLGLPVVPSLSAALASSSKANLSIEDQAFFEALVSFWPYFESTLKRHSVWSFNQLFEHFSEDHPSHYEGMPSHILGAMEHLMIDEFQDISPQIVKWIRGCKKELARRGNAGTLMCVGDDWQSIYGWRGSSPDYFVRFEHHFPADRHLKLMLENNFRSSDNVLRCAESVFVGMDDVQWKTCSAQGEWARELTPVLLHRAGRELPFSTIAQLIAQEAKRTGATEKEPMLVLARSGKTLKKIRGLIKTSAVRTMTIHSAKGLESRSVVLLDDCSYSGRNPLRNFLYGQLGLGSYDKSQEAEARRLAYVGITRAMERCYWFAVPKEDGAFEHIPRAQKFAKNADFRGNQL